jgi:hypothetical protein
MDSPNIPNWARNLKGFDLKRLGKAQFGIEKRTAFWSKAITLFALEGKPRK